MEIDLPPRLLPHPQDPPRGVCIKHSLLTKHVNVVDGERTRATEILQCWDLNINDILSGHFSCAAPIIMYGNKTIDKYYLIIIL